MPIAYILLAQQFLFVHHPCCLPSTTAATLILHANSWVRCLGELLLRLLLSARRVAALCRMAAGAFLRAPANSSAHIIQHPTQSTQSGKSSKLQAEAQGRVRWHLPSIHAGQHVVLRCCKDSTGVKTSGWVWDVVRTSAHHSDYSSGHRSYRPSSPCSRCARRPGACLYPSLRSSTHCSGSPRPSLQRSGKTGGH